jgi:hypothetical protein
VTGAIPSRVCQILADGADRYPVIVGNTAARRLD